MDFYDLIRAYLEYAQFSKGFAPSTLEVRRNVLINYAQKLSVKRLNGFTLESIEKYVRLLGEDGVSINTIASYMVCLRGFARWLNRKNLLDFSFDLIDVPKRRFDSPRQPLAVSDVQAILSRLRRERDRLIILVMYASGLLVSEALNVKRENIRGLKIDIVGKGGKKRTVNLHEAVMERLNLFLDLENIESGFIFRTTTGKQLSTGAVRAFLKTAAKNAGIERSVFPHLLRHSFGAQYTENGGDIRSLQIILGHNNIKTTQVYMNMNDRWVERQYRKNRPRIVMNYPQHKQKELDSKRAME